MNKRLVLAVLTVPVLMLGFGSAAQGAPGESVQVVQAPLYDAATGKSLGTWPVEVVTAVSALAALDCPATRFCLWTGHPYTGSRNQFTAFPWNTCIQLVGIWENQIESAFNHTNYDYFVVYEHWDPQEPQGSQGYGDYITFFAYLTVLWYDSNFGDNAIGNNTASGVCRRVPA